MPVITEYTAQGLEPKGVSEAVENGLTPVFLKEHIHDAATKVHHAVEQPARRMAMMERKLGDTGGASR